MPGASDSEISDVFSHINSTYTSTHNATNEHYTVEEILTKYLPFQYNILETKQIDFYCRCNKESFKTKLISFGADELNNMKTLGQNELTCQFCNSTFFMNDADFDEIIALSKKI